MTSSTGSSPWNKMRASVSHCDCGKVDEIRVLNKEIHKLSESDVMDEEYMQLHCAELRSKLKYYPFTPRKIKDPIPVSTVILFMKNCQIEDKCIPVGALVLFIYTSLSVAIDFSREQNKIRSQLYENMVLDILSNIYHEEREFVKIRVDILRKYESIDKLENHLKKSNP